MSDEAEIIGELPRGKNNLIGKQPHPCWELARNAPGQWVRTTLSAKATSTHKERHPDFTIVGREGIVYVRYDGKPRHHA